MVRELLDMPPADLSLYLEDDLVIQDLRYADKMAWFHQRTDHRFVLMPHRREPTVANAPKHLYVDGPIKSEGQAEPVGERRSNSGKRPLLGWPGAQLCSGVESPLGQFLHQCSSGSPPQRCCLASSRLCRPLETAATGTVLAHFPVLKPSWACREFLTLEHGNPSFLPLLGEWPRREYP